MREFFVDQIPGMQFTLFGPLHNALTFIVILGLYLIYYYRDEIKNISPRNKTILTYGLIIILYLNMFIYYNGFSYYGIYSWKNHLPIHFCYISSFSFMIALLLKKKNWLNVIYFFTFIGPLPAIIWPKMVSSFDSFIFYQWIISHHIFLLGSFLVYYMYDLKITKKDFIKVFFAANLVFIFATIFNYIFNTNYIFSNQIPKHVFQLYPFLRHFNYPIILLEITGMCMAFVAYIPVILRNKEREKEFVKG